MNNSAGKKAEIKKFSSETCIAYTELMYKLIGKRVSKKRWRNSQMNPESRCP